MRDSSTVRNRRRGCTDGRRPASTRSGDDHRGDCGRQATEPDINEDSQRIIDSDLRTGVVGTQRRLVGRDVLVETEHIVRVVSALERLQPIELRRPVRLPDPFLALVHHEVHIHAGLVRGERRPVRPRPLAFGVEALRRIAVAVDVERKPGAAPREGRLVLADPGDRSSQLPQRDAARSVTRSAGRARR